MPARVRKKCPHGHIKYYCLECDGAGICPHKLRRNRCVECGGSGLCAHNIRKGVCKKCEGSEICEHMKQRTQCADCDVLGTFKKYRLSAIARGYDFQITPDDLFWLSMSPCSWCGDRDRASGVDRIDNSLGYINGNVVACCTTCNRMKLNYSEEYFLNHVEKISRHQSSKGAA